jgi:hypothetical protein
MYDGEEEKESSQETESSQEGKRKTLMLSAAGQVRRR